MARFYTLFALVASACVMQIGASPLPRDGTSVIQEAECSALTSTMLSGLKDVVEFLNFVPEASSILTILNEAITIGDDLTAQCASGAAASNLTSRDFLSGIESGIESIFGQFACNPIVQDMMGAVETGAGLLSGSDNAQIQQLLSIVNTALTAFKGLSASCSTSTSASSPTRRQLSIPSGIESIICSSTVGDIVEGMQTAAGLLTALAGSNDELSALLNGVTNVINIFDSLKPGICAASAAPSSRDLFSGIGGIIQQIECSSGVATIEAALQTIAGLISAVPGLDELSQGITEAVSLAQAASASCKSS